ncbi:aspartic peptidase domain-containing protein [Mycena filopes]|nr:aspartic peptidase domain-containing protein [Mycena filopes]
MSLRRVVVLALAFAASAQLQATFLHDPTPKEGLSLSRVRGSLGPRLGQAVNNNMVLANEQQYTYVITACVGSQCFQFVLDTGSSDFWVVCDDCLSEDCKGVPRFSPAQSISFSRTTHPFHLEYLTGSVSGEICYDTVLLGPFSIANQVFAIVDETAALGLASTGTSGILGLCFPASAAIPPDIGSTMHENLMSTLPPTNRCFAFHLGRMSGSNDPNASFTIGSLDSRIAPDPTAIAYSPVVCTNQVYDYWKICFERMTVNGVPFLLSDSRVIGAPAPIAVLDTGTTLVLGPTNDVAAFYALFGPCARFDAPSSTYLVRCNCAILVSFVLGSPPREFFLDPADIAWEEGAQGGWCTGGIQANDGVNSGDWLLGDVFLRNVYTVHCNSKDADNRDAPTIGLLNMTNPMDAMRNFVLTRGPDVTGEVKDDGSIQSDGWDTATGYVKRWEQHPSGAAARMFGAVAGGIGFLVGGVGAIGWRFWRGV